MANEAESATVRKVVAYLRKEAVSFDRCVEEGEALGEDVRWARVKKMAVNTMADRIERGDWKAE
jgi:hypothetical protein